MRILPDPSRQEQPLCTLSASGYLDGWTSTSSFPSTDLEDVCHNGQFVPVSPTCCGKMTESTNDVAGKCGIPNAAALYETKDEETLWSIP